MAIIKSKQIILLATILFAVTLFWQYFTGQSVIKEQSQNSASNSYLIRLELKNTLNQQLTAPSILMKLPTIPTSNNQITRVRINDSILKESDPDGYTKITMPKTAPFGFSTLDIHLDVISTQEPEKERSISEEYLSPSLYIESHDLRIINLSKEVTSKLSTDMDKVKAIFSWVVQNISYNGFKAPNQGALHAFKTKSGDCTEFSYLTAALLRAVNIPSRIAVGFVADKTRLLKAENLHNWVEVYIDNQWKILDPQNNVIFPEYKSYVQLGIINENDASLGVISYSQPHFTVTF